MIGMRFQFTHPVRGATTYSAFILLERPKFQFTHPVRGATHWIAHSDNPRYVSIHAPRAGCDTSSLAIAWLGRCFNSRTPCGVRLSQQLTANSPPHHVSIHAPRAGCDTRKVYINLSLDMFQFTHPVRGATIVLVACSWVVSCFNSRTPCGVRRLAQTRSWHTNTEVSIHAPRAGCDGDVHSGFDLLVVSIHAPRAGCDRAYAREDKDKGCG